MATKIEWTDLFWSYVDIRSANECWPWKAGCFGNGYGQFRRAKRKRKAHQLALELTLGRPINGLACHTCDNPPCCNPAHLYEGTHKQNAQDREMRGRGAHNNLPHKRGEENSAAKLRSDQVLEIRALRQNGHTYDELAVLYKISRSQIANIVRGKSWQI